MPHLDPLLLVLTIGLYPRQLAGETIPLVQLLIFHQPLHLLQQALRATQLVLHLLQASLRARVLLLLSPELLARRPDLLVVLGDDPRHVALRVLILVQFAVLHVGGAGQELVLPRQVLDLRLELLVLVLHLVDL